MLPKKKLNINLLKCQREEIHTDGNLYFVMSVTYVEVTWSLQWVLGMVTEGHPC